MAQNIQSAAFHAAFLAAFRDDQGNPWRYTTVVAGGLAAHRIRRRNGDKHHDALAD